MGNVGVWLFGGGWVAQLVPEALLSGLGVWLAIWLWFGLGPWIGVDEGLVWRLGPYGDLFVVLVVFGGLYAATRVTVWAGSKLGPRAGPPAPSHPARVGFMLSLLAIMVLTYLSVSNPLYGDILGLSLDEGGIIVLEGVLAGWLEWYRLRGRGLVPRGEPSPLVEWLRARRSR